MIDAALLEEAKCYLCLGVSLSEALKMALLARIAAGGAGALTPWTSDIDGGCFNLNNVCKFNGIGVYRASLTQTGTNAPVATVSENTIGAISWVRDDVGIFIAQSAALFTSSKTIISGSSSGISFQVQISDASNIFFYLSADDITWSVEILVYPATPQCPDCV